MFFLRTLSTLNVVWFPWTSMFSMLLKVWGPGCVFNVHSGQALSAAQWPPGKPFRLLPRVQLLRGAKVQDGILDVKHASLLSLYESFERVESAGAEAIALESLPIFGTVIRQLLKSVSNRMCGNGRMQLPRVVYRQLLAIIIANVIAVLGSLDTVVSVPH